MGTPCVFLSSLPFRSLIWEGRAIVGADVNNAVRCPCRPCTESGVSQIRYEVEGGCTLSGSIEPGGNKNAALPIIAAALLTDHKVTLENVPRIRDTETLVDLVRSVGAKAEWAAHNTLEIEAKNVRTTNLD